MTDELSDRNSQPDALLSDDEQQDVIDQFEEMHRRSQDTYDASVRTIAAGAVAVTASLTAAFESAGWSGSLAVGFSIATLFANLSSYWTAQWDAAATIERGWARDRRGVYKSRWRQMTGLLNGATFFLLLATGVCLLVFVSSSS